jgi:hypothetical protein
MCAIPGVTYNISTDLVPSWLFPQSCVIIPEDVQTDLENDVINSAREHDTEYWQTGCDKRKSHGCRSTNRIFVVASANLCLACNLHLTRVNYRTLLQANNQHFSPVISTKPSYWLVSRHTRSPTGQHKEPETVYTVEFYSSHHKQCV